MYHLILPAIEEVNVTIFPETRKHVLPSEKSEIDQIMPSLFLVCGLEPDTLEPNINYITQWIVPGGQIISSSDHNIIEGRFSFTEEIYTINSREQPSTILLVANIFYQDAGIYICEGKSTAPGASTQRASASIEVQLNCK